MIAHPSHDDSIRLVSRLVMVSLALLVLALPLLWGRWLRLSASGERAEGIVLATETLIDITPTGQINRTYAATYSFEAGLPDGGILHVTLEEDISRAWHEALNPGETVAVRYSPKRPDFAMIEGNRAKIVEESLAAFALSLAGIAALLAIAPLIDLTGRDGSQAGRFAGG